MDTNINGDNIDTYYNLVQEPRFLNNKPPYLSDKSPALKAGINTDGSLANMGFDPIGTCQADHFPREQEFISADSCTISGRVHKG